MDTKKRGPGGLSFFFLRRALQFQHRDSLDVGHEGLPAAAHKEIFRLEVIRRSSRAGRLLFFVCSVMFRKIEFKN